MNQEGRKQKYTSLRRFPAEGVIEIERKCQ